MLVERVYVRLHASSPPLSVETTIHRPTPGGSLRHVILSKLCSWPARILQPQNSYLTVKDLAQRDDLAAPILIYWTHQFEERVDQGTSWMGVLALDDQRGKLADPRGTQAIREPRRPRYHRETHPCCAALIQIPTRTLERTLGLDSTPACDRSRAR